MLLPTSVPCVLADMLQPPFRLLSACDQLVSRMLTVQGDEVGRFEPSSLANYDLAVSLEGRFIAVASFSPDVKIWEVNYQKGTGAVLGVQMAMALKGHNSQVMSVAFDRNSQIAATASKDRTLRIWNIDVRYAACDACRAVLCISRWKSGMASRASCG